MAVEMVLLAPVFVMFALLVVAGGRYVETRADIEAATRDAARAASYQRSYPDALAAARATIGSALSSDCGPASLGNRFVAGEPITVTLRCEVSFSGLGLVGLPGSTTVTARSSAPLDYYRSDS